MTDRWSHFSKSPVSGTPLPAQPIVRLAVWTGLAALLAATPIMAQTPQAARAAPGMGTFGSGSKEPIAIESDHLEVFDKEQKAIYSGNVVVVQGETTMKSGRMVVYYVRNSTDGAAGKTPAPAPAPAANSGPDLGGGTSLRKVEAFDGVTIVSKDQIATSREAVYDKDTNRMILTGDASLTQNGNITKGEKVVYDLTTGVAVVEASPNSGRVKSLLVPNSGDKPDAKPAKPAAPATAPAPAKPPQRP